MEIQWEEVSAFSWVATVLFGLAVLHTFSVGFFKKLSHRFPQGSIPENVFHLLSEVEAVFGIWAGLFVAILMGLEGREATVEWMDQLSFTEPLFVFVMLVLCSTKPVLDVARSAIQLLSRLLPLPARVSEYFVILFVGPLLGSFITEPAAMTVSALVLLDRFYQEKVSTRFKYTTIGTLFVNVSVGGVITPFAAPPVLMVAEQWGWDLSFMVTHFGWRAVIATFFGALLAATMNLRELRRLPGKAWAGSSTLSPIWLRLSHLAFLGGVVAFSHHPSIFAGLFLFFLGWVNVTREYQEELRLREGLMVAFFLAGLVVMGKPQDWWLKPLLSQLDSALLYTGATLLTAVTDNAALTYLGSQVPNLSSVAQYMLVAGAVTGGGLTVIANAPNPAGYSILNGTFGDEGIQPLRLFLAAALPTLIAVVVFGIL